MYRLWTLLKLVGIGIHDGLCGVRSIHSLFQVVGCSSRLVLGPCLWKSGIVIYSSGAGAADLTMMVQSDDGPQMGWMETVRPSTPLDSERMSPDSPQTVAFDYMADSSVPLSPNRVQVGKSQDVPDEGSLFHVSPVSPGFLMRLSGAVVQQPGAGVPLPQTLDAFTDPVLGDPIAIYDAIRSCIYAGTVFSSDGFGVGRILSTGGVVLRYAQDYEYF